MQAKVYGKERRGRDREKRGQEMGEVRDGRRKGRGGRGNLAPRLFLKVGAYA